MKKVLGLIAALTLGFASMANAQFHIGGRLGAGMATLSSEHDSDNGYIFSFQAGVQGAFTLPLSLPAGAIEVESGLFLNRLGASSEEVMTLPEVKVLGKVITKKQTITETNTLSIYALTIPLEVNYAFPIASTFGLYLGTGPQMNIALGGSTKTEIDKNGETESSSQDIKFGDEGLNRVTFDWRFQAGAQLLKHVRAGLYFDLGMSSHMEEVSIKNRNFGLSVSYLF